MLRHLVVVKEVDCTTIQASDKIVLINRLYAGGHHGLGEEAKLPGILRNRLRVNNASDHPGLRNIYHYGNASADFHCDSQFRWVAGRGKSLRRFDSRREREFLRQ